jgi:hypothetical protein
MAALPAASDKTVSSAEGSISAGTENDLPAEKPSWRDRLLRLLCPALRSLGIRGLKILSKSLHGRFDKLDPDFRHGVVNAWVIMATILVLALAVPPLLLVYFLGQQVATLGSRRPHFASTSSSSSSSASGGTGGTTPTFSVFPTDSCSSISPPA